MVTSLSSKWAVGKARGGRISESIRNRRATRPPAHFQRNPPGRASWLFFRVARSTRMTQIWALRSRLEKQPTDLRRRHHYLRDGTLVILPLLHLLLNLLGWPVSLRLFWRKFQSKRSSASNRRILNICRSLIPSTASRPDTMRSRSMPCGRSLSQ